MARFREQWQWFCRNFLEWDISRSYHIWCNYDTLPRGSLCPCAYSATTSFGKLLAWPLVLDVPEHRLSQLRGYCQPVVHQYAIVLHRHLWPQWIRIGWNQFESLVFSSLYDSSEAFYPRDLGSQFCQETSIKQLLSSNSSVCCFCSFCLLDLLGGSIAHTSWSLSMTSLVDGSTSITCTSLNFLSFGWAGVMLIGIWSVYSGTLSVLSVVTTSSRLMFHVVLDSLPINCQNE